MDGDVKEPTLEDFQLRLVKCIEQISDAFPVYACVRCGSETFSARYDEQTWPRRDGDAYYEAIEVDCRRCGLTERPQMRPLRASLASGDLSTSTDDE
jgi:hypothetical protein